MSIIEGHVSLIDLSKQFNFQIDAELKKELCFGETLLISCGHYEGEVDLEGASDSDWTCAETDETEAEQPSTTVETVEVRDLLEEEPPHEESDEDNDDFQFYFFPDCNKPPPPKTSKSSIVMVNGIPKLNPKAKVRNICVCEIDRQGVCECFVKLPCKCGAKTKNECTCKDLQDICICKEVKPNLVCTCRGSKICLCHPDGKPRPICTCDQVDKPCICHPDKFPFPVCVCKHKPKFDFEWKGYSDFDMEEHKPQDSSVSSAIKEEEYTVDLGPCACQDPDNVFAQRCLCPNDKPCICNENSCVCGVIPACFCEPTQEHPILMCVEKESITYCTCNANKICTCEGQGKDCKCYPVRSDCTCGDPNNCTCFHKCECVDPCICDTADEKPLECICFETRDKSGVCTCPCKKGPKKLKKIRAGKQGYRWCHDVDPKHTFFDFAYDQHDKIDYKFQEKEKLKILGLYDEKADEELCPVHGIKVPEYKKKVRKASLDCCSTVGGISINIETLGEEANRFLVQVVSHSSKEGAKTGTKIISIVDSNLHTLEENRVEYITKKDLTKERRSYIALCESGYYNKVTRVCGEHSVVNRLYHSFEDSRNFLLEGANIVLLRYFGLRRYKGTIKTDTVMMNGTICESIYFCPGVSQAVVNNTPVFVVKVERHIIEPTGVIHQTLSILTLRGYLVSHEWANNNYIMHLNPLLRVNSEKDEIEPHAPLRAKWREDLQLLSDYLNFKTIRTAEGARYMAENGSLTASIKDYLQAILLLKPQDVRHFTRHYFSSVMSALDLPHDDYFDPCPKHVRYFYFEE